ncbi:hypothetical protein S40288_00495 [Stachybotrys chartarum IBT 40288]|nr:hypothetical protein S40288_00495 [Stachybotrys chartarum IBT 40288]
MSAWYSNILTKTSSQISSLRSTLLASEADGDTDDDTHVCRVLRNYYADKGRQFPAWLPPDPKAPAPQPAQVVYAQPQVGARYGGPGMGPGGGGGAAGGLSSLWDSGPAGGGAPAPQSLRAGRTPVGGRTADVQPRPLPSQRPGSHQSGGSTASFGAGAAATAAGQAGGSSAQERLRQRFWGGSNNTSPAPQSAQGPYQPPAAPQGGGNYEDRFAPGGAYDTGRGGQQQQQQYDQYAGGGGSQGRQPAPGGRRQGLPSGPRGYR